jgi:hypothetical protein
VKASGFGNFCVLPETNLGSRDAKPVHEIETTGVGEELNLE